MTQPARLRALRLVGFKSFAEKTVVEFGPGISAVVGPNGSGKSNLADALRWTLGEQGRLLRTRRSEDVIFAGSSSRRAIGMVDVTLVIDNQDRLLPLDYGEVEIGRRLYRSGENEYLLNRQRIRLRDLSELLDGANLADNAFLFIGQGMVDQALALRPEERRPLFEEAAGVRRHERRRRQAEAELAEAEANLERVRDVLAELRPQARRLAAQAEQLQARRSAGLELAEALVAAARARWLESWQRAEAEQRALDEAHRQSDAAMAALRAAEETAERHSRALAERAAREQKLRDELDERRGRSVELRLAQARLQTRAESLAGERKRLESERRALEERTAEARRQLSLPLQPVDDELPRRLAAIEAELAELETGLSSAAQAGKTVEALHLRRRGLEVELERLRASAHELERELAESEQRAATHRVRLGEERAARQAASERLEAARRSETEAAAALTEARAEMDRAAARQAESAAARTALEAQLSGLRAALAALDATLAAGDNSALARAARARGGTLLAEGLEVEPALRRAVAAALGGALRALAVPRASAVALREQRGMLLLGDDEAGLPRRAGAGGSATSRASAAADAAAIAAAVARGGDRLATALRRDPQGHVTRLLERCLWVPELGDAVSLAGSLAPGWRVATRAGELLDAEGLLRLAQRESDLEQRAERQERAATLSELEAHLSAVSQEAAAATAEHDRTTEDWQAARTAEQRARAQMRAAEDADRASARRLDEAAQAEGWLATRRARWQAELEQLGRQIEQVEADLAAQSEAGAERPTPAGQANELQARWLTLRRRRDELAAEASRAQAAQQAAQQTRQRAEMSVALAEPRLAEIEGELERVIAGEAGMSGEDEQLTAELALATEREQRTSAELEALRREEARERAELLGAERQAAEARERLRRAEARSRSAEVAVMEARLHLEQVREQLLVELAAIGRDGLAALTPTAAAQADGAQHDILEPDILEPAPEAVGQLLESALEAALDRWASEGPGEGPPPGPGRLTSLRRQFHALGAGNPFAAQEYAEVRERLEALEAQREDLETAMANTRQLIANLGKLITDQFLATFAALEGAFARRFEQLFGGGEAQLSLTLPEDLSATGVEITARPPGKKRQPLAMLSGGERALTAVALLLAMLEIRPVPFCVLDEVDAALDEANINRFSAALRGLADRIQFVVITHNRGTIEAADALYGVTIGDDAVSRIVSLRLPAPRSERPSIVELPVERDRALAEAGGA